jgi:rod shape-determining protein MreB
MRFPNQLRHGFDFGIDLGTANTLVAAPDAGLIFNQPSVCCFKAYDAVPTFVAAGAEAHRYVGKVSRPLKIVRPLRNGVVSDLAAARELLRFVLRSVRPSTRLRRLRTAIGVPSDATQAEKRALTTAATDAGLAEPVLIAEPLLAAIGLDLDVDAPRGRMIVDCGGGTTDVAVISLGAICVSETVRGGGEALDQALADHLHFRHRFQIGAASAECLKLRLSARLSAGELDEPLEIGGLDAATGLPRQLEVPTAELAAIWERHAEQIVRAVRTALRRTPPELSQDIFEDGVIVTGGATMAGLLASRIARRTGVAAGVSDAPLENVADGLMKVVSRPGSRR